MHPLKQVEQILEVVFSLLSGECLEKFIESRVFSLLKKLLVALFVEERKRSTAGLAVFKVV